jgi:energy-converting hydrogenase B subunit Q
MLLHWGQNSIVRRYSLVILKFASAALSEEADMSTAINVICVDRPGMLRDIAGVIAKRGGNIVYTQQFVIERGVNKGKASVYMEIDGPMEGLVDELQCMDAICDISVHPSFEKIYGSRVIIIGGGAQVAQAAVGAVNEADRHNLRGERISVDTIPLVGESAIADAVSAVSRLHRASILVLAGALMGGRITEEVRKLQEEGIPVIALKMAGSVPEQADLVVTDPIQAGTFAVMHVASTAVFDIKRVRGKEF